MRKKTIPKKGKTSANKYKVESVDSTSPNNYEKGLLNKIKKVNYFKKNGEQLHRIINNRILKVLCKNQKSKGEFQFNQWCLEIRWDNIFDLQKAVGDRIDIVKVNKIKNKFSLVIIESDAARADQVVKKFASRLAFLLSVQNEIESISYFSFCYPASITNNEVKKYLDYCIQLSNSISKKNFKVSFFGLYPDIKK